MALTESDYEGMAQAMCNMGGADAEVDVVLFSEDIKKVMGKLNAVQPDVTVTASSGADGSTTLEGTLEFDEEDLTWVLLDVVPVTENNELNLPREFGLLVIQSLYFDQYLKILAPGSTSCQIPGFPPCLSLWTGGTVVGARKPRRS